MVVSGAWVDRIIDVVGKVSSDGICFLENRRGKRNTPPSCTCTCMPGVCRQACMRAGGRALIEAVAYKRKMLRSCMHLRASARSS